MTELVDSARAFLGVPFRHRGRSSKRLDCAGLVWCAFERLGHVLPDLKRYGREPHRDGMMRACVEALGEPILRAPVKRSDLQVGDVLVLRFEIEPHHMGIVGTDRHYGLSLIHADGSLGVRRVVEHGLDDQTISRICAVFRRAA